jgi:hypothetical protein
MPIEPIDPTKKVGDGKSDKYTPPKEKFGPSEYDKAAEKVKQDNERARAEASKMAEAHREKVKAESPRTYTERLQDMGRLPKPSGTAGAKIELEKGMMGSNMPKPKLKAGGVVSSASKRADGCAVKGKTKGKMV